MLDMEIYCLLLLVVAIDSVDLVQLLHDKDGIVIKVDVDTAKQGVNGTDIAAFLFTSVHSFLKIQFFFEDPLHPINVFRLETTDNVDTPVSMELKILDDLVVLETRRNSPTVDNLILGTLKPNTLQNLTLHFHGNRISMYNFCRHLSTKPLDRNLFGDLSNRPFLLKTFYGQQAVEDQSFKDVTLFELSTSIMEQMALQDSCYKKGHLQQPINFKEEKASYTGYTSYTPIEDVLDVSTSIAKLSTALHLLKEVSVNQNLQVSSIKQMKEKVVEIEQGEFDADANEEEKNSPLSQLYHNTYAYRETKDACLSNPCFFLVPCFITTDANGYQCGPCPPGMEGDGSMCRDINECLVNPCSSLATCLNRNPGYVCSECPPGFKGSAVYGRGNEFARSHKQICEDRDECEIVPRVCPEHTYCNNTVGGYFCTSCEAGFAFNKFGKCARIRECEGRPRTAQNPCSEHAKCSYALNDFASGQIKSCECRHGYAGNGFNCGKDSDYDGYPDEALACEIKVPGCKKDNCPLVPNSDQTDTDIDGIGDECDEDDDNDGVLDKQDNCQLIPNKGQKDIDKDGIGDLCENCPKTVNRLQTDSDKDGYGDACDIDIDNDGLTNNLDNCPFVRNIEQWDTDGDGVGDLCDNCPYDANTIQLDTNSNGIGDVCDTSDDRDSDGLSDIRDNCPYFPNAAQLDTDGDSIGNVCDEDDDNDGFVDPIDNCPLMHNLLQFDIDDNTRGDVCEYDYDDDGTDSRVDTCPLNSKIWQTNFNKHDLISLRNKTGYMKQNWIILDKGRHVHLKDEVTTGVALIGRDVYEGFDFKGVIYVDENHNGENGEVGIVFCYQNSRRYYLLTLNQWSQYSNVTLMVHNTDDNDIQDQHGMEQKIKWQGWHGWRPMTSYSIELKHRPLNNQVRIKIEGARYGRQVMTIDSGMVYADELKGGRIGLYASHQNNVIWSALSIECKESSI